MKNDGFCKTIDRLAPATIASTPVIRLDTQPAHLAVFRQYADVVHSLTVLIAGFRRNHLATGTLFSLLNSLVETHLGQRRTERQQQQAEQQGTPKM